MPPKFKINVDTAIPKNKHTVFEIMSQQSLVLCDSFPSNISPGPECCHTFLKGREGFEVFSLGQSHQDALVAHLPQLTARYARCLGYTKHAWLGNRR